MNIIIFGHVAKRKKKKKRERAVYCYLYQIEMLMILLHKFKNRMEYILIKIKVNEGERDEKVSMGKKVLEKIKCREHKKTITSKNRKWRENYKLRDGEVSMEKMCGK